MDDRTSKIIKDLQTLIHSASPYEQGSVKSHVYAEGYLLAVVARMMADDSHVYSRVVREIRTVDKRR